MNCGQQKGTSKINVLIPCAEMVQARQIKHATLGYGTAAEVSDHN